MPSKLPQLKTVTISLPRIYITDDRQYTVKLTQPVTILSFIASVLAYTTTNQVIADIVGLNAAVVDLTAATAAYQGGLFNSISQAIDFTVVEARLTQGDADTGLLPPSLTDSDTQDIIDTVASTLAINNHKAVAQLIAKKSLIESSGEVSIVEVALEALLAGHLTFEQHIITRSPADSVQGVENVTSIITDALQNGINAFAS